jgi:hypothetical protein
MGKPWFAPKRYGYGAGMPIAWQGWMVMLGFIAAVILVVTVTPLLLPTALAAVMTICANIVLIALVAGIARAKTAGGWRWRWGEGP